MPEVKMYWVLVSFWCIILLDLDLLVMGKNINEFIITYRVLSWYISHFDLINIY